MWVRGLKLQLLWFWNKKYKVAPHVGAWIETAQSEESFLAYDVAPHVGAWIET